MTVTRLTILSMTSFLSREEGCRKPLSAWLQFSAAHYWPRNRIVEITVGSDRNIDGRERHHPVRSSFDRSWISDRRCDRLRFQSLSGIILLCERAFGAYGEWKPSAGRREPCG